jgi:LuxR family maltose regulon positive regulatory protein
MKLAHAVFERSTNLYTRRYFDKIFKTFVTESQRERKSFSLLLISIDNFKVILDKYGHSIGNKIFSDITKILKQSVRRIDLCFRYDEDKIAIILPNALKEVTENITMRLKTKIETYAFSINGTERMYIGLSIGMAFSPDDGLKYQELMRTATIALSHAKQQKKKRTKPFVLKTKLTLPALKETTIPRRQLISLFANNRTMKLLLVVADAGYGKTTLLTHIVYNLGLPSVYYEMDRDDSNLMVFLSYLLHGLELFQPNLVERTHGLLEGGTDKVDNYESIVKTLVNELLEKTDQELFIILDDYHAILDGSLVHKALDYFISHVPPHVHIIIASRVIPPLPSLAKWRAKQDLFELSRNDLRFTKDEITTLFNTVYRMMLSHEELNRICKHTEGWITGIQLIVQSADKRRNTVKEILNGYVAAHQPLFGYFAHEILACERPHMQVFLKHSAILETMTPDACNTILGVNNSSQLLRYLEKRNLFVSKSGENEYKYHRLFRNFLKQQLEDKNFKKALNLKAAHYYRKRKQIELAIQHYLHAEAFEKSAKLIIKIAEQIDEQARYSTLSEWLAQIPEVVLQKYPQLLISQGNCFETQGNLPGAREKYTLAEQLFKHGKDKTGITNALAEQGRLMWTLRSYDEALRILRKALSICPTSEEKLKLRILYLLSLVLFYTNDFKKSMSYLARARRIAERMDDFQNTFAINSQLGSLYVVQGEARRAFELYKSLIESLGGKYWAQVGILIANAARAAIRLNKTELAEQWLDMGRFLCQPYEDPWSKAALYHEYGHLYMHKIKWGLAEQHLHKALDEIEKVPWVEPVIALLRDFSRLYRYQGNFLKAEEYLEQALKKIDDPESIHGMLLYTERSMLQVCLGKFDRAEKTIKICLQRSQKYRVKMIEFLAYLAAAVINLERGNERRAVTNLHSALDLARTKGYSGVLLDELRSLPKIVNLAQKYNIERNYLVSLNLPKEKSKLQLNVYCFGLLRLEDSAGRALSLAWPTVKTKSLFAFLIAHHETPVHREFLIEQLWPDVPKNRASINFRTTATRMRQSLLRALSGSISQNEIFICRRMKYQLLPQFELRLDTEEFILLLKEAERIESEAEKARIIKQALSLYKEDYLSDIYDSWTDAVRRLLYERRLSALHWLAQYTARQGDDYGCIEVCESYLSLDPFSEEITRIYMKCLARLGRVKTVKALYKSLKHTLHKELHHTPSQETEDLYQSIVDSRIPA